MQPRYAAERADRPGVVLFDGPTLEEVAAAVAAQPEPHDAFVVYAHAPHAFSRDLNPAEELRLRAALSDGG